MTRGYLWERLLDEVMEEFRTLEPQTSQLWGRTYGAAIADMDRQARFLLGEETRKETEFAQAFLRPLREAAHAKRRGREKAPGECSREYCRQPRVVGIKLCQHHREIACRAAAKQQEKKRGERMEEQAKLRDKTNGWTCEGVTHKFTIIASNGEGGVKEVDGYISSGVFPDGRLGEVFVKVGKPGDSYAILDQWARSVSITLQKASREEAAQLLSKFLNQRFEPSGATKNPKIPRCSSLVDYVARYLLQRYYPEVAL